MRCPLPLGCSAITTFSSQIQRKSLRQRLLTEVEPQVIKQKNPTPKPRTELFCVIPKSQELQPPIAILQRYLALTIMSACSLIFCQCTWTLTPVVLWCVCSIVIYPPQSERHICSSNLAVFWTISFMRATCVSARACQI